MYNLLKAGFYRLRKDITFWIFLVVTIGAEIFALFRIAGRGYGTNLYTYINEYLLYIGIFMSMFISIFVGKEYSEGIIRNKIIVRSQKKKYLFCKSYYKYYSFFTMRDNLHYTNATYLW